MKRLLTSLPLLLALAIGAHAQYVTTLTEPFDGSGDIAVAPNGDLVVGGLAVWVGTANTTNHRSNVFEEWGSSLFRFSANGELIGTQDASRFGSGLAGLGFDSRGILYTACMADSSVLRVNRDGVVATHARLASPRGVTVDDEDNVYVVSATSVARSSIVRINPQREVVQLADLPLPGFGLARDQSGNFYVSELDNCSITKVDPNGTRSDLGCLDGVFWNRFITYANERLYVAGLYKADPFAWFVPEGVIYEVLPNGDKRIVSGAAGAAHRDGSADEAQFLQVTGLEASRTGDSLYVVMSTWPTPLVGRGRAGLRPSVVRLITGLHVSLTAAENERPSAGSARLEPTYPNPVTIGANVPFVLGVTRHVRLELYDILGRHVRTLLEGIRAPGRHEIGLIAVDLPAGAYVVRLKSRDATQSRMLFVNHGD